MLSGLGLQALPIRCQNPGYACDSNWSISFSVSEIMGTGEGSPSMSLLEEFPGPWGGGDPCVPSWLCVVSYRRRQATKKKE